MTNKDRLIEIYHEVVACKKCPIHEFAKTRVFGSGLASASMMLVGEAPGVDEDIAGKVFVGNAGGILTACLTDAGIKREWIFIANILKCHPPKRLYPPSGNRAPTSDEMANCLPFLHRQIEIIRPRAIVALGKVATHGLLGLKKPPENFIKTWVGRQSVIKTTYGEVPVVVSVHPQYLGYNQKDVKLRDDAVEIFRRVGQWLTQ